MAITASKVTSTQSLEEFRLEFNKLQSDVTILKDNPTFTSNLVFEGATADAFETTLKQFAEIVVSDKSKLALFDEVLPLVAAVELDHQPHRGRVLGPDQALFHPDALCKTKAVLPELELGSVHATLRGP